MEDTWIIYEEINDVGDDFGEKNSPWTKTVLRTLVVMKRNILKKAP